MSHLWSSLEFWGAVAFACLVKITSQNPPLPPFKLIMSLMTGVLGAFTFTPFVLEYLGWSGDGYQAAIAGLVALTSEHVARQVLALKLTDLVKILRGQSK